MPIVNKREFTVKVDDKEIKLIATRPNQLVRQKADVEYAKAWGSYVKQGMILEVNLWDELKKQKLWDETKQTKLEEIDKRLDENQAMLPDEKGKVKKDGVTLKKAREAAIQMRIDRIDRVRLLSDLTRLKGNTCEGFAENTKFNYLVSQCIVTDTNKPYFSSLEDYMNRASDDECVKAAEEFAILYYDHDPDFDKGLPENKFLVKYNMCRKDDLALTDKEGNLVDIIGNKVDENGNPITENKETEEEFDIKDDWN